MLRGQTELLKQSGGGAGVAKLIVDTDAAHGGGALLGQNTAHGLAQAAQDVVLLAGDDLAALAGAFSTSSSSRGLMVAMLIIRAEMPASARILPASMASGDHQAVGDDGHIGAVLEHLALADLKGVASSSWNTGTAARPKRI